MNSPFAMQLNLPVRLVLPVDFHFNLPFLLGRLNGRPCRLLLDSGAPSITLNALHLPEERLRESGELMGASGAIKSFLISVDELRFEDWTMGPMEVRAINDEQLEAKLGFRYDGLIGFRQLIHYDWMVDYQRGELHLWATFPKADYPVQEEVRIRYMNHLPVIEVEIAGEKYQLLIDTGSGGMLFDQEKAERIAAVVELGEDDELRGAGGRKLTVSGGQLKEFTLKGIRIADSSISFADISPLVQRLGPFDGIIGYSLLSQVRTVVSWENRHLYLLE
ncbi:MAG: retropepsin-like aspartic protease [Bacteroidota bacterium]